MGAMSGEKRCKLYQHEASAVNRGGDYGGAGGAQATPWGLNVSETGDTLSPNLVTHLSLSFSYYCHWWKQ